MNKILVTGLGIGSDFGVCSVCNLDFSWLVSNPSTLVWVDKILLTQNAWQSREKVDDKFDKAVNIILEKADKQGVIEIIKPKEIFQKTSMLPYITTQ